MEYTGGPDPDAVDVHRPATLWQPSRNLHWYESPLPHNEISEGRGSIRARPGLSPVEDRRAEAAWAEMRPDGRSDDRDHHIGSVEAGPADDLRGELVHVGRHRMEDRRPLDRPFGDQRDASFAGLRPGPRLVGGFDEPVLDRDDRLDRQERADRRLCAADPAAL